MILYIYSGYYIFLTCLNLCETVFYSFIFCIYIMCSLCALFNYLVSCFCLTAAQIGRRKRRKKKGKCKLQYYI